MDQSDTLNSLDSPAIAGKYLTFLLGKESYGISIKNVYEIFGLKPITRVPCSPEYVKGVINLRGKIIPIINLRAKFGLPEVEPTEKTCIIVVNFEFGDSSIVVGIIVDTVLEVSDFDQEFIANAPDYGSNLDTDFIIGMATHEDDRVIILVDIKSVFAKTEVEELKKASQ